MLEQLFGSKARAQLLRHFLADPGQRYYLRQLARDLSLQLNSVRREISNLEKLGIIVSGEAEDEADEVEQGEQAGEKPAKKAGAKSKAKAPKAKVPKAKTAKKYFAVNQRSLLYPELKSLMVKAQLLMERKLIEKIKESGSIRYFILTGAFVNVGGSSTDMLIVGTVTKKRLEPLVKKLEKEMGRPINYTLMTPKEFQYRHEVTDVFIYGILEGKKIVIVDELTGQGPHV